MIERVRRCEPMHLAAEIIWGLLPPLAFATDQVVVAGILEPCFDIGGDAFDYVLNGDVLSVAVFDALGHGIPASLLATLAVGAYRNARRRGLGLVDTARSIDQHVHQHGAFVSAVLAELDGRHPDHITVGRRVSCRITLGTGNAMDGEYPNLTPYDDRDPNYAYERDDSGTARRRRRPPAWRRPRGRRIIRALV